MRSRRTAYPSNQCATKRAIWIGVLVLCAFTVTLILKFEFAGSISPWNGRHSDPGTPAAQLSAADLAVGLGFPYPQLSRIRELLLVIPHTLDCSTSRAAYHTALKQLQPWLQVGTSNISSSHTATDAPHHILQLFLNEVSAVLRTGTDHLQCQQDGSLIAAWQSQAVGSPHGSNQVLHNSTAASAADADQHGRQPRNSRSKHYLLAANFHNSAAVLPNFIVQTLRLALLLPPGHLAVSVYESGSSDTTRMWLTLLHYMLLPLEVPHNLTTAGLLSPRLGLSRIQLLAHLRNALIEPWLGYQQHRQQQHAISVALQEVVAGAGRRSSNRLPSLPASAVAGSAELTYRAGSLQPDTIIFANDVFFCSEDVLRLVMHDAHMACGMDFYTATWQQEAAAAGGKGDTSSRVISEDDDDFFDPKSMQLQLETSSAAGHSAATLRFYDKWVARDITGRRLRNRHPFIKHTPSLLQLLAGQPVPMRCCWNGLVALAGAPLVHDGVRFRTHIPGECAGSECSLLCDDLLRLGFTHIVMDQGVRLTYELDQVNMLGGAAKTTGSQKAAVERGGRVMTGLGVRLPWADVAATSAKLATEASAEASTGCSERQREDSGRCSIMMECCDLKPGHSYVNFRKDCHLVDIMAHNFTAAAAQAAY